MAEEFETPYVAPEQPKKSNTGLIIGVIVVVVFLCFCCALIVLGWSFGDAILGYV